MPILEFLASGTASMVTKFLIDQITEYKKRGGKDKEVEALKGTLETYREKNELLEKELEQFKKVAQSLEMKLGDRYLSDQAFVSWSLGAIKSETSSFKIYLWTEKGNFKGAQARDVVVVPRVKSGDDGKNTKTYKIGDKINLYFNSERDCYLTLMNYGTSGKLTILLPNAIHQDNFIKGGRTYAIPGDEYPFDYELSGPAGTEKIKAIATTQKLNLIDLSYKAGEIFPTSKAAAKDISVVAKKIENTKGWAEAECEMTVIE